MQLYTGMEDNPTTLRMTKLVSAVAVLAVAGILTVVTLHERSDAREPGAVGTSGTTTATAAVPDTGIVPSGLLRQVPSFNPQPHGVAPATTVEAVPALKEGEHVEVRVALDSRASNANGFGTLWVGTPDQRVLVVLPRDTRNELRRLEGEPASQPIQQVEPGRTVTISGTVYRVPRAEQMHTWGLTTDERRILAEHPFYIRADSVTPTS